MQIIPVAVYTAEIWNGRRKRSGRIQRKGTEINQNTRKPMNSGVVAPILAGNVFFIFQKEGHMAVMHTLRRNFESKGPSMRIRSPYAANLPPFQPDEVLNGGANV